MDCSETHEVLIKYTEWFLAGMRMLRYLQPVLSYGTSCRIDLKWVHFILLFYLPIMSSPKSLIFRTFSNCFTSSNRAKSVWQSSYLVLNSEKRVYHIKHPLLCSIKAIFPLFHYDGEPSVSNGIVYQLPSYHLLIHWVPTKLSNRVMPYGGNFCRLQLLFVFDFTDHSRFAGYGYSVDASPCFPSLVSFWFSTYRAPSSSGFFPEPCSVPA